MNVPISLPRFSFIAEFYSTENTSPGKDLVRWSVILQVDVYTLNSILNSLAKNLIEECKSTFSLFNYDNKPGFLEGVYCHLRGSAEVLYNLQEIVLARKEKFEIDDDKEIAKNICKALEEFLEWQTGWVEKDKITNWQAKKDWVRNNQEFLKLFKE